MHSYIYIERERDGKRGVTEDIIVAFCEKLHILRHSVSKRLQ